MDISTSERSHLKENILASKLEGVVAWISENRPKVLMGAGVVLVVLLISSVLVLRRQEQSDLSWTRIAQAQAYLSQKQWPLAEQILQDLKTTAPTSTIRLTAKFYLAELKLEQKQYDEAILLYSDVVAMGNRESLKPLALSALGFTYEEKKDFSSAVQTYQKFIGEFSDHFLAARTQLALGRAQLLLGDKESAKKSLGQLIDLYPNSEWAKMARNLLGKL